MIKGLLRFFIDSIDECSPMGERFRGIHESHRNALRTEHLDWPSGWSDLAMQPAHWMEWSLPTGNSTGQT